MLWDLVVVGAGPAGAVAALSALRSRPGAHVLLLDKADFPRDKVCGDGIAPQVDDELRALGAAAVLADVPAIPWLRLTTPSGATAARRPARPNYVVPRAVFDARLVDAARGAGAELRRARVRGVREESGRVALDTGRETVWGRVVIGADGVGSTLRRALGIPANPPGHLALAVRGYAPDGGGPLDGALHAPREARRGAPPDERVAPRIMLDASRGGPPDERLEQRTAVDAPRGGPPDEPVAPRIMLDASRGGPPDERLEQRIVLDARDWPAYAWSFPTGTGTTNVGYGLLRSRLRGGRAQLWGRLAELLPDRRPAAGTLRAAQLPLSSWRPDPARGRVLLAGDAASLVNPLTGEGIYYAVVSGRLAGVAAVTARQPATAYRRELRRALGRHLRLTGFIATGLRRPTVVEAGIGVARDDQAAFDDLVALGLADGLLPAATMRKVAAHWLVRRGLRQDAV